MGGREAFGAAAAAPRGKSEDGRSPRALPKLPSELLGLCLSYSTRWSAVACSQVVCKRWRSLCRGPQVSLRPLLVVTLSGRSALLVLDGSGGVRCSLPAAPGWNVLVRHTMWRDAAAKRSGWFGFNLRISRRSVAPRPFLLFDLEPEQSVSVSHRYEFDWRPQL